MSQTSAGYPLDNGDNADLPRCPMEAMADRIRCMKRPAWLSAIAWRDDYGVPFCYMMLDGEITTPEQLDDLINFLQEVRG